MISVIASSEIVSMVKFASFMIVNATSSDDGIAISTTTELRHERRKKSITMPVNVMPSASGRHTASICCCVYLAWTLSTSKSTAG